MLLSVTLSEAPSVDQTDTAVGDGVEFQSSSPRTLSRKPEIGQDSSTPSLHSRYTWNVLTFMVEPETKDENGPGMNIDIHVQC